jgi:P27 family predicted phage terminase small subunit
MHRDSRDPNPIILDSAMDVNQASPHEALPPAGLPDCPDYLDDVAKAKWPELCRLLADAELLNNVGRDVMAMYCSAFSQWREAADMVKKSGLIIKGTGGICANPCVKIAADAKQEMLNLSALLGLDPSYRSRLRVKHERIRSQKRIG